MAVLGGVVVRGVVSVLGWLAVRGSVSVRGRVAVAGGVAAFRGWVSVRGSVADRFSFRAGAAVRLAGVLLGCWFAAVVRWLLLAWVPAVRSAAVMG